MLAAVLAEGDLHIPGLTHSYAEPVVAQAMPGAQKGRFATPWCTQLALWRSSCFSLFLLSLASLAYQHTFSPLGSCLQGQVVQALREEAVSQADAAAAKEEEVKRFKIQVRQCQGTGDSAWVSPV